MGAGLQKLGRADGERRMHRSVALHTEVGCEAGDGRGLSLPVPAVGFALPWGGMPWGQVSGCVCCPYRPSRGSGAGSHNAARCPLSPE